MECQNGEEYYLSSGGPEFKLQLVFGNGKSTLKRELRTTTWWHRSKEVSILLFLCIPEARVRQIEFVDDLVVIVARCRIVIS